MKFDKVCFIGLVGLVLVCGVISFLRKDNVLEPEDITVSFNEDYTYDEDDSVDIYSDEYIEIYGDGDSGVGTVSKGSVYPTGSISKTEETTQETTEVQEAESNEDGDILPISESNYIGVVRAIVLDEDISILPVSENFKSTYEALRGTLPALDYSSLEIKSDLCSYDNHNVSFTANGVDYNFTFTLNEEGLLDSLIQN